jgi:hypothetical protein
LGKKCNLNDIFQNNNNENGGKFSNFVVRMSLASVKYVKYAYLVPDVVAYDFYTSVLVPIKHVPLSI